MYSTLFCCSWLHTSIELQLVFNFSQARAGFVPCTQMLALHSEYHNFEISEPYYIIYNTTLNTSIALGDSGNMQTYLIQIDVQLKFRILLVLLISDSFFTCWSMEYICQMTKQKHFYGNIFRNGFCTKLHK